MDSIGVFNGDDMFALAAIKAKRLHRRRRVFQQIRSKLGIDPSLGNHPGAVLRANLMGVGVDDLIQCFRVNQTFFDQ